MALTCKQLAQAWGIAVTKVTQAREPTFRKMARAMLMFPTETMEELSEAMAEERSVMDGPRAELDPREMAIRECALEGGRGIEELLPRRDSKALLASSGTRRSDR